MCSPYILTLEWLEESIKLKRPAPEENFLCGEKNIAIQKITEPPSPLSKKVNIEYIIYNINI